MPDTDPAAVDPRAATRPPLRFKGSARLYLRIAVGSSVLMCLWLYGAFAAIRYLAYGETWPLGWKPAAATLAFAAWFALYFYRSMMRLDAQYGSGSGWRLVARTVKLPEQRARPTTPPA
jgi:hypothetical protein